MPHNLVIKTTDLTKHFGATKALQNFSIEVKSGQILGLLGPNGSGKTTLIKSLVGGVKPTSGTVEVFGKNPLKNRKELAGRFGYMPQDPQLYEDLSVKDNVRFFAKLHLKGNPDEAIDKTLAFLGLSEKTNERVQHLSGGMKTRTSLACALIHEPDVLFLDEPTAGLDPSLKRSLWQLFRNLASGGKTLFISTHLMEEALLCDTLAIIRQGELLAKEPPAHLIAKGNAVLTLTTKEGTKQHTLPTDPTAIARFLHKYGLDPNITALDLTKESLEDITINIVEGRK